MRDNRPYDTPTMEDDMTSELARPWTPGPWARADCSYASHMGKQAGKWASAEIYPANRGDEHDVWDVIADTGERATEADAALIALAPDMAEAILEQARRYPDCDIVKALAQELRGIGANDE